MTTAVGITIFLTAIVFFFAGAIVARLGCDRAQRHCANCDAKVSRGPDPRCPPGHGCNPKPKPADGALRLTSFHGDNQ